MKYIKKYKIFEDSEEEDENALVPEGFKYSWNDIHESLLYLTDIGFKIDEKSERRYLADEKGEPIKGYWEGVYHNSEYKSNVQIAKNAIYTDWNSENEFVHDLEDITIFFTKYILIYFVRVFLYIV